MENELNEKKSEIFKALANPVRLDVIDQLKDGEKSVGQIQQTLAKYEQPHISKCLAKLKSVGLINDRREGMNVFYSLRICCIKEFLDCLTKIIEGQSPDDVCK